MPKAAQKYISLSACVWLDYSARERRIMLDLVDLFGEHDTRDEQGIGSVRDTFADMLFPGTSTIVTRARYFLRPMDISETGAATRQISRNGGARQAELNLVEPIERSDDNDGNHHFSFVIFLIVPDAKVSPEMISFDQQVS
jgi:hypothetical protein